MTGRLKTRSWDQNGEKKYRTEIIVSDLEMLDSKGESKEPQRQSLLRRRRQ